MSYLNWILCLLLSLLNSDCICTFNTLHIAPACFSKNFKALNFNESNYDDVPLRRNGNKCGEDDFSVSRSGNIYLFNVADGVGSWRQFGINPKIFTRELLRSIGMQFKALNETIIAEHDKRRRSFLLNIVSDAYDEVQTKKKFIQYGSCTIVSLSLNLRTLHLNSFVLGDSGFMIIRKGKIVYRSIDLIHSFNMPYQLNFGVQSSTMPSDGYFRPFKLRVNDILIIGSDGLFDNLFDAAILYYANQETKYLTPLIQKGYSEAARRLAKKLTIEAKRIGETINEVVTPFSEEVNALGILDQKFFSGKNDDTTVVVAIIS